ncbi:PepSY domain-containing protein [Endozoicomonas sp. SCSIO W0465]|uniref:PepSY domain-containing protein n=1 Tax=Endozoicomonas sp. SCSIO W0465 TaxID=2918516 RepID=UPI0020756CDB|nr:PepSY domain-containing protein [Endozoicomonas sp. SCSIO W0465]USE38285.1 hypothetical protein MJO57_09030 [Endozoicomonas sp. SCSIO W0465]
MKMLTFLLVIATGFLPLWGQADSKPLSVVKRGDAVSYQQLVDAISRQFHGRIVRVELEQDWLNWYYELRLLQDDGRIIEVELEAKTLRIIEVEGANLETVVRQNP